MEQQHSMYNLPVLWRGMKYVVEISSDSTLRDLGEKLLKLTEVQADTMRLIVPQFSSKSSKMLYPFSDEDGFLALHKISIFKDNKPIRMMGVSKNEVDEVLKNEKKNERIAGFDEEEQRLKQRMSSKRQGLLKLPGPYVFCEFRTLQIPGIELNPPASEALKRMHMLAADPGIVAIMNKHRWRVGIMTEMAPVGYVGVSPKCILGFNKNHGEEISLRLRTDDLKGFRKYERIKKTLLHELAHMIYSEHDANFYALDKQLNEEAATLDWTRSKGHTLSGVSYSQYHDESDDVQDGFGVSQKLGGSMSYRLVNPRASSVSAAYHRLSHSSDFSSRVSPVNGESNPDENSNCQNKLEPDPDVDAYQKKIEPDPDDSSNYQKKLKPDPDDNSNYQKKFEPDPDDSSNYQKKFEPDPDDSSNYKKKLERDPDDSSNYKKKLERDPDDSCNYQKKFEPDPDDISDYQKKFEPDPDDISDYQKKLESDPDDSSDYQKKFKPDPDDSSDYQKKFEPDPDDSSNYEANCLEAGLVTEPMQTEPGPDESSVHQADLSKMVVDEPDPDDQEIQRIQDSVSVVCIRLREVIARLLAEVRPSESAAVFQTLFKIVRNVIEHPGDMKYTKFRKANPTIQKNVANYKAALEILFLIGFIEDVLLNEMGNAETFLVLKRNDPGLLWLAKSTLETCNALYID
ncbi:uncharacterized protein LOC111795294 isoform X2 [Cucurbita pepo subsp. pepo]|uniref:uncharacterized protein LOC111795294 isoform X2 n=1 Tax=Cucurbita pepo subsp. pepo TaxID=3664 RepID=UPI000C9D3A1C|nr:uncharacterized protein LOC111795294 isoform X2 [Cucurbita pepo subsp. pepo]